MKSLTALVFVLSCVAGTARADAATLTLQGYLDDSANTHLVGSDLGVPLFVDDFAIANNVALYELHLAVPGSVTIQSEGFTLGGIDPYFTLFAGVGGSATFADSNFFHAFSFGGDFTQVLSLGAGQYTIAISAFANMSLAENLGAGALGDGFTGLGVPDLGNYLYKFTVTTPEGPGTDVPEPSAMVLLAVGLAAAVGRRGVRSMRRASGTGTLSR